MYIYAINWYFWFTVISLIIAFSSLIIALETWKKLRYFMVVQQTSKHSRQLLPGNKGGSVYVIYNPSKKINLENLKKRISFYASNTGMDEPIWLPTEKNDSGYSMALQAIKEKASLVITAGGDGTVRAVSAGLCGTDIPMGILPVGTTNLLARNLGVPINNLEEAISVAMTGRNRQIDMGWMKIIDGEHVPEVKPDSSYLQDLADRNIDPEEFAFMIMSGMGFDGDMMAGVPDQMKRRIGWLAYVFSALRNLRRERMDVNLRVGTRQDSSSFKARTVLFANCGHLPGNIVLLPDAHIDDGWLDVAIIDIKSKLFGWLSLAIKVILQGVGIKSKIPEIIGKLDVLRTHKAYLVADKYYNLQIDGEYMGRAKEVKVRVQSEALVVRT